MRLHLVSDVHGAVEPLRRAGADADALICLGDLLCFLDYYDYDAGVFGSLFGPDAVARLVELRTARRFSEARDWSRTLWEGLPDGRAALDAAIERQYADMFAAMPTPTYATYGNVDIPALWEEHAHPGVQIVDGEVVEIGGLRFGFVGGGLQTPMRTPHELSDADYAAKVAALGPVDVLCAHIPPAVPVLTYDVIARRLERGSTALYEAILEHQPALMFFGHVHQPLASRTRIGRTECVNVGHFARTKTAYVLDL
ncbi:MAG: metallophosphoesterase [Actinomycetota bacterium]|nr:metallophosphoesterase [Actinomycetota bacterium]